MIVVDIETSGGFSPYKNGVWQIGGVHFNNPNNVFLEESRIDDEDCVEEEALKVIGKSEEELRDKNKQSQKQLLTNFFAWAEKINDRILVAHNTPFDYGFLALKAKKYDLKFPFKHRTFDLHTIASVKYFELNGRFLMEQGGSNMGLSKVLELCGMKDERIQLKEGKVVKEGKPHNALEDAKLEAECLSRILYGKQLLPEFKDSSIPKELEQ